jgi:hypothetical protein
MTAVCTIGGDDQIEKRHPGWKTLDAATVCRDVMRDVDSNVVSFPQGPHAQTENHQGRKAA